MESEKREGTKSLDLTVLKTALKGWHFWILVTFAIFFSQADGIGSQSGLPLWLKDQGHSVESINTITTIIPAVTIVSALLWGIIADAYDAKVFLIAFTACLNIFAGVCLAIWNIPVGLKYFSFFLAGTANAIAAIVYAWANEICAGNAEERALVVSAMNTIGNTFGA